MHASHMHTFTGYSPNWNTTIKTIDFIATCIGKAVEPGLEVVELYRLVVMIIMHDHSLAFHELPNLIERQIGCSVKGASTNTRVLMYYPQALEK